SHRKDHKNAEKRILQSLILTRAFENLVYVVFSNAYNEKSPLLTPYSAIAEPHKIIGEIFDREGMIIADVDLGYLQKMRTRYRREYNKII
ncbi:MAG: hypothetical protein JXB14_05100, partial [Candidatus Altiarchaeota archaeon]|nr:hypothetical protein [Candidatus Altiarchaeota archaeon]